MLANTLLKHWTHKVFSPEKVLQTTYNSFRELLEYDGKAHEEMATIEALYYQGKKEDFSNIRKRYEHFSTSVLGMVEKLEDMAPGYHTNLKAYYKKFDFYSTFLLAPPRLSCSPPFIYSLEECSANESLAGGKASQLAALATELKLPIPDGFVISANSFNYFMEENELREPVDTILRSIDYTDPHNLIDASNRLIALITESDIPIEITDALATAWKRFTDATGNTPLVAVRSSSINEDGACSFAGQYLTLLNVAANDIPHAWLQVISSKYTPEALAYRINSGLGDEETGMAVLVLEMLDAKSSGVLYTNDPSGQQQNELSIHAVQGRGDILVSGRITPEVYTENDTTEPHNKETTVLTSGEQNLLLEKGKIIADHFQSARDIEWSFTRQGKLIFLQNRPLEIQQSYPTAKRVQSSANKGNLLFKAGTTAALGQACGPAYVVDPAHPLEDVEEGAILVIKYPEPAAVRVLKKVSGVVTELGSVAGHFSTVCREFEIPLLVAVGEDIHSISHGETLSLLAENCEVWQGKCFPPQKVLPIFKAQASLPYFKRLNALLSFVTPLNLLNPEAKTFVPESCRSLHDIIRFSHEQAVRHMFSLGSTGSNRSRGKQKLVSNLPLDVFLLDVGDGLETQVLEKEDISLSEIRSTPFLALWQGLNHSDVKWEERSHFDWKSFDEIALAGGIASKSSSEFASFAVLGRHYVNLNIRFGYHFTLVDTLCDNDATSNYCQLRFAGGGGDFSGRNLRIQYVTSILKTTGFQVTQQGDLLDARVQHVSSEELLEKLQIVGHLLGETKLMDMRLKNEKMVEEQINSFWKIKNRS